MYLHPKQDQLYYIKRIRRRGRRSHRHQAWRAIVNGMTVEEPYLDSSPVEGRFAELAEI